VVVRRCVRPAVILLVAAGATACAGASAQTVAFCTDYGDAMHELVAAAREYAVAPDEFGTVLDATLADLRRLRAGAPDERLRGAFDTASFMFTVFSGDAAMADFLARADFRDNEVVAACAEYGVEVD